MCGIAGVYFKKAKGYDSPKVAKLIDELLLGIESRGKDATGYVAVTNKGKKELLLKEPLRASLFVRARPEIPKTTRMILLHTRWATQGLPTNRDNNHPVQYGSTYVTHNGHINNDDELFKENRFKRIAQVDTEIIAAMVDMYGFEKINLALKELDGGFAIAVADPKRNPDELILAKGPNSPLKVFDTDSMVIWASEYGAIQKAWKEYTGTEASWSHIEDLDPGEMYWIKPDGIEKLNFPLKGEDDKKPLGFSPQHVPLRGQLPVGQKPNTDNGPNHWGCKGCNHRYADHPTETELKESVRCKGSPRCNCRRYVSRHTGKVLDRHDRRKADAKDFTLDEIVSYVGVGGVRCGVLKNGALFRMDTLEEIEWPSNSGVFSWELENFCENCAHVKYRHIGNTESCGYPSCECVEFVPSPPSESGTDNNTEQQEPDEIEAQVMVECDGCKEWIEDDDTDVVMNMILCPACTHTWDEMSGETETKDDKPTETSEEKLDREHTEKYNYWLRLCVDEVDRHKHCLKEVAAQTGYHEAWIDWILFRCPLDLYDDDPFLKEARGECDELYADAEEKYLTDKDLIGQT